MWAECIVLLIGKNSILDLYLFLKLQKAAHAYWLVLTCLSHLK